MARSEARWLLARLSEAFGVDGVLVVPKPGQGAEGADLVPGSGLRWPPCRCGSPRCPDFVAPDCDICAALVRQRADARTAGDTGAAALYGKELENHPH